MSFRLPSKSVTFNGAMALILLYFTDSGSFRGTLRIKWLKLRVVVKKFTFTISSRDEFLVQIVVAKIRFTK